MAGKRYENMDGIKPVNGLAALLKWRRERKERMKTKDWTFEVKQTQQVDLERLRKPSRDAAITWVGHSTFVIQLGGLTIVTDPVWAETMAFQQRLSPPGIALADMPPVDVVLISHGHYDHLHIASLRKLKGEPCLFVPEGLGPMLRRRGFKRVVELAWWQSTALAGVRFTFVPAQHWTRRTPWDMNTSHWGGWIMADGRTDTGGRDAANDRRQEQPAFGYGQPNDGAARHEPFGAAAPAFGGASGYGAYGGDSAYGRPGAGYGQAAAKAHATVYFAGDSGYFRGFAEIGRRFAIDCALMPIGAYEPEWFMSPSHMTPEEAVRAFLDTGARTMLPMHYGAFRLADDTPKEALDRLHAEWRRHNLDPARLLVPALGATVG